MSLTLLDLSAVGLAGVAVTGAVLGFASPRAHMAPAGEPGFAIEMALEDEAPMRTADTRLGGRRGEPADAASVSLPRIF